MSWMMTPVFTLTVSDNCDLEPSIGRNCETRDPFPLVGSPHWPLCGNVLVQQTT